MALVLLAPLAALIAALLAWQHATRLDRQSQHQGWSHPPDDRGHWTFVLGALIAAVLAATVLQTFLLAAIRSLAG